MNTATTTILKLAFWATSILLAAEIIDDQNIRSGGYIRRKFFGPIPLRHRALVKKAMAFLVIAPWIVLGYYSFWVVMGYIITTFFQA